jgi:hypothetical protein
VLILILKKQTYLETYGNLRKQETKEPDILGTTNKSSLDATKAKKNVYSTTWSWRYFVTWLWWKLLYQNRAKWKLSLIYTFQLQKSKISHTIIWIWSISNGLLSRLAIHFVLWI